MEQNTDIIKHANFIQYTKSVVSLDFNCITPA